jgi:hypothetical protein
MLRDNEVDEDLQFRPNVDERLTALMARYSTRQALLDELALAQEETCVLLAALPQTFTHWRKHFYRRLALWAGEYLAGHLDDEHAEQLKRTIAAVS